MKQTWYLLKIQATTVIIHKNTQVQHRVWKCSKLQWLIYNDVSLGLHESKAKLEYCNPTWSEAKTSLGSPKQNRPKALKHVIAFNQLLSSLWQLNISTKWSKSPKYREFQDYRPRKATERSSKGSSGTATAEADWYCLFSTSNNENCVLYGWKSAHWLHPTETFETNVQLICTVCPN